MVVLMFVRPQSCFLFGWILKGIQNCRNSVYFNSGWKLQDSFVVKHHGNFLVVM